MGDGLRPQAEQIDRDMLWRQLKQPVDGPSPVVRRIAHETADQIEVEVADAGVSHRVDRRIGLTACVAPVVEQVQLIIEGLYANAHPVGAEITECRCLAGVDCRRLCLDRELPDLGEIEVFAQRVNKPCEACLVEVGRRTAADENGGNRIPLDRWLPRGDGHLRLDCLEIVVYSAFVPVHLHREVAVGAPVGAERYV